MTTTRGTDQQPAHLCKFNGRTHVTARFLCARFDIPQSLLDDALAAIESDGGQGALRSGVDHWIDADLFYELSTTPELSPSFSEARQQTVLLLLGHYDHQEQAA